eukprot:TRINITY_DN77482_c0_g1_i1.p1 TRINITY_DN77482_c0_g1~~TRINITY_DN77482_c0_g1_i1.p1  ORF type:complete len:529 (+),score=82.89 TRINITY_DN77482_c0_g1_i1:147-1733(+)
MGEPPSRCAECGNVLTDALVLSCGHDLCLGCAASALRQTRSLSGRTVRCLLCPSVTELHEEAAATLKAAVPEVTSPTAEPVTSYSGCQPPLLPQPQVKNTICTSCGNTFMADAIFCRRCGQKRGETIQAGLQSRGIAAANGCRCGGGGAVGSGTPVYPRLGQCSAAEKGRSPRDASADNLSNALHCSARLHAPASSGRSAPVAPQTPVGAPAVLSPRLLPQDVPGAELETAWSGRMAHIPRCPHHPEEPATYFCATCECPCICAECVVQKNGQHHDHEVLRVGRAHEVLRSRAAGMLDEAVALEDDFAMIGDRISWRRKDIERAAARGRASVRSAFARVRAQLNEREAELLESLDNYESDSIARLDSGTADHNTRLNELRRLQDNLRSRCRSGGDAVEALNTYSAAKQAIASLREAFRQEEVNSAGPPEEFVGLAGSARAELELHAEGLASLEEAVASLCERGVEFPTLSKINAEPGFGSNSHSAAAMAPSQVQHASAHPRQHQATGFAAHRSMPPTGSRDPGVLLAH